MTNSIDKLLNIFIVYSRKDAEYKDLLLKNLKVIQRNSFNIWHDQEIKPGEEWDEKIKHNLKNANIVLLLISVDALTSDYITDYEIKEAFEKHLKQQSTLIPVLLRSCMWQDFIIENISGSIQKRLGDLEAITFNNKPLVYSHDKDEAFTYASAKIKEIVKIFSIKTEENNLNVEIEKWNNADKFDNIKSYQEYLNVYPQGKFKKLANDRIILLDKEEEIWNDTLRKNAIPNFYDYIVNFPSGKYIFQANLKIKELKEISGNIKIDILIREVSKLPHIWQKTFKFNAYLKKYYALNNFDWQYWLSNNGSISSSDFADYYDGVDFSSDFSEDDAKILIEIEKIVLFPFFVNNESNHIYEDLTPLYLLPKLEILDLCLSHIVSLKGVNEVKKLKKFFGDWANVEFFYSNHISELKYIEVFHFCYAENNYNLEFIKNFKNVKEFGLRMRTRLSQENVSEVNLSFLAEMSQITLLKLTSVPIGDYSFLTKLINLKTLSIVDSFFDDLSYIKNSIHLEYLNISTPLYPEKHIEIKNINNLSIFSKLTFLEISRYNINEDISIKESLNIVELYAWDTYFKSFNFLSKLLKLRKIYFGQTPIANPLPYLRNIEDLCEIYLNSKIEKSEIENFINSKTQYFTMAIFDKDTKRFIEYKNY